MNKEEEIKITLLGKEFNFFNFFLFVKKYIAPYMEISLVEEEFHRELFEECAGKHSRYSAIQMSRGLGKTEFSIWLDIYCIVCQPINSFSGKKIREQLMITSGDDALKVYANRLKDYFYHNPILKQLIPIEAQKFKEEKRNDYWNQGELYFLNGSIVHLRTILSKSIRGLHPDRVVGDDLVGENSALIDRKLEEIWFSAVDGTTTAKNALVNVFGTPKRLTDVMQKMNNSKGYYFKKMPVIQDGKIISKRWSQEKLNLTRERIGSVAFQSEYLLNPIDDSTSLIRLSWIRACLDYSLKMINTEEYLRNPNKDLTSLRPEGCTAVYLGVDFAFSDRITADKSVFTIIAEYKKEDQVSYVLVDQIIRKGMSGIEQLDFIKDKLNPLYSFDLIGLEENSLTAIRPNIRELNLPIRRFWTGSKDEKQESKAQDKHYTTVSKRNLILRLGTCFENRELILPYADDYSKNNVDILMSESISFAQEEGKLVEIGEHPDAPISLAYALEVGKNYNKGFLLI